MNKEFESNIRNWAEKVINECSKIAENSDFDMKYLFYPLQSAPCFQPEILFIGTNPGSTLGYRKENLEDIIGVKENLFLKNYEDPNWKNLRSLTEMFSGTILKPLYEKANIINMFYFNSGTFNSIKNKRGANEAIELCKNLTLEYINLVQPKTIIIFGKPAKIWFTQLVDDKKFSICTYAENKCELMSSTYYKSIPVYSICHPTTAQASTRIYNVGENLKRKQKKFEEIFKDLNKLLNH